MEKRWISFVMALAMCLSLLPTAAFAQGEGPEPAAGLPHKCSGYEEGTPGSGVTGATVLTSSEGKLVIGGDNQGTSYTLTGDKSYYLDKNLELSGTLTIASGEVNLCLNGHDVKYTGASGSVFKIESGATLNLYDCTGTGSITGGKADNGGGVYVNDGTFNMYGGTITGNTATTNGGGVYVNANGSFTMSGGTITGNTAETHGGGVYFNGTTFNLSGASRINGNTAGATAAKTANNVYLPNEKTITITDSLTGKPGCIGVTVQSPAVAPESATVVATGGETHPHTVTVDDAKRLKYESESFIVVKEESGTNLVLAAKPNTWHDEDNADFKHKLTSEGGKLKIDGSDPATQYTLPEGSYYLDSDLKLNDTLVINGYVDLCLKGKDIQRTVGTGSVILINGGATLNLYDCNHATRHGQWSNPDKPGTEPYVIYPKEEGRMEGFNERKPHDTLIGGCIRGGTGKPVEKWSYGGGVYVGENGTFNMHGGKIAGNEATNGGGVYVRQNGTFKMYGGKIAGNKTTVYGSGGGVSIDQNGNFTMEDGSISNNVSSSSAGGVNISIGSFTMSGGNISGNTSTTNGGGVYNHNGTFKLSGTGSISGNNASQNGGGVYVASGTFKLSGTPVINGNRKGDDDNNVYLPLMKTITIDRELTEPAKIGVTMQYAGFGAITEGNQAKHEKEHFFSDNPDYGVVLVESELKLVARPPAPNGQTIDYTAETISNTTGLEYQVCGSEVWKGCTKGSLSLMGVIPGAGQAGTTIKFRKAATESEPYGKEGTSITIPARPAAPAAPSGQFDTSGTEGKVKFTITAVAGREYSQDGANWKESNVFDNLEPYGSNTFYVRTAAVNAGGSKAFASTRIQVETITKLTGSGTVTLDDWTSGEAAKPPSVTGNTNKTDEGTDAAITYTYYTDANCTTKTTTSNGAEGDGRVPANVGTYWVKALVAATDVYAEYTTKADSFTIQAVPTPPSTDDGGSDGGDSYHPTPKPEPTTPPTPVAPEVPNLKPGETTTETKPDGTKVEASKDQEGNTTVTETKKDGTVIQAEEKTNGDKSVTETKPDGSSVKSEEKANGDKLTTKTDPEGVSVSEGEKADGTTAKSETDAEGKTKAEVKVSEEAAEQAQKEQKPVELPLPPVTAEKESEKAPEVKIELHTNEAEVKISIPVEKPTAGTVAVIVKPDGTKQVLPKSLVDEKGLTLEVGNGATVKIVDNSKTFQDVKPKHWAAKDVDFVSSREIFNGTGKNIFKPNLSTSRGMITQVLYNMESQPGYTVENDFGDVADGKWYTTPVNWAAENDVINGYSNGNFGPNDLITREQLVAMLYRYSGKPVHKVGAAKAFDDARKTSKYAREAMDWAVETGIIKGIGKNMINPKGLATRAESAAMITRFMSVK